MSGNLENRVRIIENSINKFKQMFFVLFVGFAICHFALFLYFNIPPNHRIITEPVNHLQYDQCNPVMICRRRTEPLDTSNPKEEAGLTIRFGYEDWATLFFGGEMFNYAETLKKMGKPKEFDPNMKFEDLPWGPIYTHDRKNDKWVKETPQKNGGQTTVG